VLTFQKKQRFINFKIFIWIEDKRIPISKVAFNPDQSLRHDKHCQDKQSSLEILDLMPFKFGLFPLGKSGISGKGQK